MKQVISLLTLSALLMLSCGEKLTTVKESTPTDSLSIALEGDSTLYGLACDGCTDTILVFLPQDHPETDPDTFNVLAATQLHRVFGRAKVGDRIAVVRNAQDSTVADFVFVMEDLNGSWCYQVMPTLRERADQAGMTKKQILNEMPDSLREAIMVPREYGMRLLGDNTVHPIGNYRRTQEDAESPVVYPEMERYRQWRLFNGKLLLTAMTIDSLGDSHVTKTDTADFVMLRKDTLVLRFSDKQRGYYRAEEQEP